MRCGRKDNIGGVEIDTVAVVSLKALTFYEVLFGVERLEVTDLEQGKNEAAFTIFGAYFHILDEKPGYRCFPRIRNIRSLSGSICWFRIFGQPIKMCFKQVVSKSS